MQVDDLIAEARELANKPVQRDDGYNYLVPAADLARFSLVLERLADALEAVSARPLVADKDALADALADAMQIAHLGLNQFNLYVAADALFASGVIQSKGDAQAEALEEAAEAIPGYCGTPQIGWAPVGPWLCARAAAYRTPGSPNSEGGDRV